MFEDSADYFGFLAASCVLISTITPSIRWIRVAALFSNIFFVAYGLMHNLPPVLALHTILLPINLWHVLKGMIEQYSLGRTGRVVPFRNRPHRHSIGL